MISTTAVLDRLLPDLHAESYAALTYWTQDQLIAFTDQAAKQLSAKAMLFVERDLSQTAMPGAAAYALPPRHLATIHVSYGTHPLRPATTIELEARDPGFLLTPGTPDHWYEDNLPIGEMAIAPVPIAAATPLPIIASVYPTDVDAGQPLLEAPAPVAIYLSYYVLGRCYSAEGESEEPELGSHCLAQCKLLEALFQHLYGEGL